MDLGPVRAIDAHVSPMLTATAAATLTANPGIVPIGDHAERSDLEGVLGGLHADPSNARVPIPGTSRYVRDMADLLGCDRAQASLFHTRDALDWSDLTRLCTEAAALDGVLLTVTTTDTASKFASPDSASEDSSEAPWDWHQQFVPVHRLLTIEALAEQLIAQVDRFDVFLEWFRSELEELPDTVVGLVSTAAERSGLDVQRVSPELATEVFYQMKAMQWETGQPAPLIEKALVDGLLVEAIAIAAARRLPVQITPGRGRSRPDPRLTNPLHLRPLLEDGRYQSAPIILRQAAYPFVREAATLAATYAQVYLDVGLFPLLLSLNGMRHALHRLLEAVPPDKLLYASNARWFPDLIYLGATQGRHALGQVLEDMVEDGDLSAHDADRVAIAILQGNARSLYALQATP